MYVLDPCQDDASLLLSQTLKHQKWMDTDEMCAGEYWTSPSNVATTTLTTLTSFVIPVTDEEIRRAIRIRSTSACAHD